MCWAFKPHVYDSSVISSLSGWRGRNDTAPCQLCPLRAWTGMERQPSCQQHSWRVGLKWVWRSSTKLPLFPEESCPCREEEIICTRVSVWLHQCSWYSGKISLAVLQICRDLKEGPVGTGGVHLQGRKLPGVPLSLRNLDKEVVLGLAKSFLPALLRVRYPAPELLRWGFPAWCTLGSTLSDPCSWDMSLPFSETLWDVPVACTSPGSLWDEK